MLKAHDNAEGYEGEVKPKNILLTRQHNDRRKERWIGHCLFVFVAALSRFVNDTNTPTQEEGHESNILYRHFFIHAARQSLSDTKPGISKARQLQEVSDRD